jgi:hypothetical protein
MSLVKKKVRIFHCLIFFITFARLLFAKMVLEKVEKYSLDYNKIYYC